MIEHRGRELNIGMTDIAVLLSRKVAAPFHQFCSRREDSRCMTATASFNDVRVSGREEV